MRKIVFALITAVLFAIAASPDTFAASIEISNTVTTAFNKTAAAADILLRSKLTSQYAEFIALQEQDREWDDKIKSLHYKNEEALAVVRQQIKQIDAEKLSKLEAEVKQTRDRYKPMLDLYKVLGTRSVGMRASVQLARIDIQAKEAALAAAKDKVRKIAGIIRDTLAGIDSVNAQMKSERTAIKTPSDRLFAEWKSFTQHVKKSDAKNASDSLAALHAYCRQIADRKTNIYNLEVKISDIIQKASGQMS